MCSNLLTLLQTSMGIYAYIYFLSSVFMFICLYVYISLYVILYYYGKIYYFSIYRDPPRGKRYKATTSRDQRQIWLGLNKQLYFYPIHILECRDQFFPFWFNLDLPKVVMYTSKVDIDFFYVPVILKTQAPWTYKIMDCPLLYTQSSLT